ncbi:MAG: alpha/beta hydrolase, partial [Cyclobacteriaceae bacterium]|nr:alpha/beta hydrolase [Cyclobacteriaceae bacterium]
MKPWKKILIFLTIIATVPQVTSGCFSFRMSEKKINDFFQQRAIRYTNKHYSINGRNIHYIQVGEDTLPTLLFIHGAPGSLSAFIHFLADTSLLKSFKMISVDRPGYGNSDFGKSVTSLEKQAALILPLLKDISDNVPTILVGHSLGGAVIARIAMDYPEEIDGMLLLAPSISPLLEPDEWFRKPLHSPFFRWMVPKSLRVTNDEILFLEN